MRRSIDTRILLCLPLLVYLLLPTRNYYWDGVAFAIDIEKRLPVARLIHRNHLIYTVVSSWLYRIVTALGVRTRALFVMQTANGILAGGCIFLLHKALRPYGVFAALLLAFSATWWRFATNADAYIPSIFFLLCAYCWLESRDRPAAAGAMHASAMLFHQLAILFLPVALVKFRNDRKALGRYLAASVAPVVLAYVFAYRLAAGSTGFFRWIVAHSPDSAFSFNLTRNAWLTILDTVRLIFGGRLDEFVRGSLPFTALLGLGVALWSAYQSGLETPPEPPHRARASPPCFGWLCM